jgi:hypothetical protein
MGNNFDRNATNRGRPDPILEGKTFLGWKVTVAYYYGHVHKSSFKYDRRELTTMFGPNVTIGEAVNRAMRNLKAQTQSPVRVIMDGVTVVPHHEPVKNK